MAQITQFAKENSHSEIEKFLKQEHIPKPSWRHPARQRADFIYLSHCVATELRIDGRAELRDETMDETSD